MYVGTQVSDSRRPRKRRNFGVPKLLRDAEDFPKKGPGSARANDVSKSAWSLGMALAAAAAVVMIELQMEKKIV